MTLAPSSTSSLITVLSVVFPLISIVAVIAVAVWRHRSHLPVSTDPSTGLRGYFFGDRVDDVADDVAGSGDVTASAEDSDTLDSAPGNSARQATLPRGVDMSIYDQA